MLRHWSSGEEQRSRTRDEEQLFGGIRGLSSNPFFPSPSFHLGSNPNTRCSLSLNRCLDLWRLSLLLSIFRCFPRSRVLYGVLVLGFVDRSSDTPLIAWMATMAAAFTGPITALQVITLNACKMNEFAWFSWGFLCFIGFEFVVDWDYFCGAVLSFSSATALFGPSILHWCEHRGAHRRGHGGDCHRCDGNLLILMYFLLDFLWLSSFMHFGIFYYNLWSKRFIRFLILDSMLLND